MTVLRLRRPVARGDPRRREQNNQPVGNITPVRVLDPYFYRS
jgi:hypothetical protein